MFKAKFIGTHNSMGFQYNKMYYLTSECKDNIIWLKTTDGKLKCPYTTIESILRNWAIIQVIE